jgi:tRNA (cmo5U34)-methyltransferase
MTIPTEWTFKTADIANVFDQHVREQLPWYDLVTAAVAQIGRHYITRGGLVYDIGASTGNIGRALQHTLESRSASLVAIDESPAMKDRYTGPGTFVVADASDYDYARGCDLAVVMLGLMFLHPERATRLLHDLVDAVSPYGAVIIVERWEPPGGYLGVITTRLTLAAKRHAGISGDEIIDKELSLSGVQRPLSPRVLAGMGAHEFFRFGDFAGYVIPGRPAKSGTCEHCGNDDSSTSLDLCSDCLYALPVEGAARD